MTENFPPGPTGHEQPGPSGHGSTGTQAPPAPDAGPRVSGEEMRDLARLRRSTLDKHVAGVAGGLGRHLDIDPVIIRVAFVVLTFFGGAGLILYVACWLMVPDDREQVTFRLDPRSRTIALVAVGALAALALVGDAWGGGVGWFPWPLLIIGLIAWLILSRKDRAATPPPAPYSSPWHGASAQGSVGSTTYAARGAVQDVARPADNRPLAGTSYYDYRPPRNPRKRGPILFWFTLGLIALALGTLGIVDLAGVDVIDSAYPALALGVIATMLLVGAFYGRAGGLIFLGLVAALALTLGTVVDRWEGTTINETPTSAAQLESSYDAEGGEIRLDLTQIRDLDALDGRYLNIDLEVGKIEVIVPEELHVSVDGRVEIGELRLFDQAGSGGLDLSQTRTNPGSAESPHLRINAELEVGEVKVSAR